MSSIGPYNNSTISQLMLTNDLSQRINQVQQNLFNTQNEISTGKKVSQPSDDPTSVSAILYLNQQVALEGQYQKNLNQSSGVLNQADSALSNLANTLRSAQSLASSQIGVGSDASTRLAQAQVVNSQLQSAIQQANSQYDGINVFGGTAGGTPFESFMGGVKYNGSTSDLTTQTGNGSTSVINSNGETAFGALSTRVKSPVDLKPQATSSTLVSAVGGATGAGVASGSVQVTVDGTAVTVDLSNLSTLGDVAARINQAISQVNPSAGSLSVSSAGFTLNANAGHSISIANQANGSTASDLGIAINASSGSTVGQDVNVQLTPETKLANLGTSVDWTSGMQITQGSQTKTLDLSGATTVQDVMNRVNQLGFGLKLQINSSKTGLNLVDTVSGLNLSVGENGGTTATDLGLRTYSDNTKLSDFRHGEGIQPQQGKNDFSVTLHNGTTFNVNIDGANTVGDVVNAIQSAATAAGVTAGQFSVGMASTGNGMTFTDNTTGGSSFQIQNLNQSLAATQLGIVGDAGSGNTITGTDNATVQVNNMFTHLINLSGALTKNDSSGITVATSGIQNDLNQVVQARATVGIQSKNVSDQQTQSQDRQTQLQTMLSNLQDANMPKVITQYQQLQTQLQASLQMGAQMNQMNLLNYLQ